MLHIERGGALIRRGLEAGSEGRVGRVFFLLSKEFEAGSRQSKESERFSVLRREISFLCALLLCCSLLSPFISTIHRSSAAYPTDKYRLQPWYTFHLTAA